MNKKLYKSEDNKVLCGVCGGLGEFLGIDPTIDVYKRQSIP